LFPATDYVSGDEFSVVECCDCRTVFTWPQPAAGDARRYYPVAYYGESNARRFPAPVEFLQRWMYRRRVARIEELAGPGGRRVLDVGCGRGHLLREFREGGWRAVGTEIDADSAKFPREILGLDVRVGTLEAQGFGEGEFDAVILWHVLEHVPDFEAILREIGRVLRPGGVFLVAVPDFSSWEARFGGAKWFHLDVPRHLHHFRRDDLRRVLESLGFEVCRVSNLAPEYDFFSWVQTLLNRVGIAHNQLYNLLRGKGAKLGRDARSVPLSVIATLLLAPPLTFLSLLWVPLAAMLNKSGTVAFYARRRGAK
jgi:SAM-dependent methyltransferase